MTNEQMKVLNGIIGRYSDSATDINVLYEKVLDGILTNGGFSSDSINEIGKMLVDIFQRNEVAKATLEKRSEEIVGKMSTRDFGTEEREKFDVIRERYDGVIMKEQLEYNKVYVYMSWRGNISKEDAKAFDELNISIDRSILNLKSSVDMNMNDLNNPKAMEDHKKVIDSILSAFS